MSMWIIYDDLVDLVRKRHQSGFSGLITGISDHKHSFQIGFDRGEIVLLTYRIKKGMSALELLTLMERAKISEHPGSDMQDITGDALDTNIVLAQLTANTLDETTSTTNINDSKPPRHGVSISTPLELNARQKKKIEAAAVRHFGAIGAIVCEEHLADPQGNVRAVLTGIAQEIGANEADTRAFFQTVASR